MGAPFACIGVMFGGGRAGISFQYPRCGKLQAMINYTATVEDAADATAALASVAWQVRNLSINSTEHHTFNLLPVKCTIIYNVHVTENWQDTVWTRTYNHLTVCRPVEKKLIPKTNILVQAKTLLTIIPIYNSQSKIFTQVLIYLHCSI